MKKIGVGVVGVGHLGKFHVEKYARMPEVDLVGIADSHRKGGRPYPSDMVSPRMKIIAD